MSARFHVSEGLLFLGEALFDGELDCRTRFALFDRALWHFYRAVRELT